MQSSFFQAILLLCMLSTQVYAVEKKEYVIGLTAQGVRVASLEDVELGFNYELNKLTKDKNYQLKIKVFPNEEQINQLVTERKILGYFGTPIQMIKHPQEFNHHLIYSPILNENILQRYVLLVRKDSGITTLQQLKNSDFGYCAVDEIGLLHLKRLLKEKKLNEVDSYFRKVTLKKNPNLAISALFFKETNATIVLETDFKVAAELNPQLNTQLVAIDTSPPYLTSVLAITNQLDGPMTIDEYEKNVQRIGSTFQNKALLQSFKYGKMRKISKEDLNSVISLIEYLNQPYGKQP